MYGSFKVLELISINIVLCLYSSVRLFIIFYKNNIL